MSQPAYVGTAQRTFQAALVFMLEHDYGLLGSQRVLTLLAQDVEALAEQFYPRPAHLASGWMVFTATKASGPKAHPGQTAVEQELVTLACPVLLAEDVQQLAALPTGPARRAAYQQWLQQRLVRIIEYGWQYAHGPALFTLADLGAMLGLTTVHVSQLLKSARQTTGKPLLTKGYYFDQGQRPTHKAETIALYEAGLDEVDIARQLQHDLSSTGKYIRDYERVKLLLKQALPPAQFPRLLDMQPSVIAAYLALLQEYHPELCPDEMSPAGT
jgi:hypothetical protein